MLRVEWRLTRAEPDKFATRGNGEDSLPPRLPVALIAAVRERPPLVDARTDHAADTEPLPPNRCRYP